MLPTRSPSPPGSPSSLAAKKMGVVLPAPRCMWRLVAAAIALLFLGAHYRGRPKLEPDTGGTRLPAGVPCPPQLPTPSAGPGPAAAATPATPAALDPRPALSSAPAARPASLLVELPPVRWPEPVIPRLIHQTWRGRDKSQPLPGWVQSSVDSWKRVNPGYTHKMHDDDDIERRVTTLHPELLPAYAQMKPIQRADLFRYMVLYDEGGYYADCDVDCTRPVDDWVRQYEPRAFYGVHFVAGLEIVTNAKAVEQRWFAREFQFVQWTMGAAPGHPICPRPPGAVKRP
jgi:hypothetical protein